MKRLARLRLKRRLRNLKKERQAMRDKYFQLMAHQREAAQRLANEMSIVSNQIEQIKRRLDKG